MGLGGVLKARDTITQGSGSLRPPASHRLFSNLAFSFGNALGDVQTLGERESNSFAEEEDDFEARLSRERQEACGWLDTDDIEEF